MSLITEASEAMSVEMAVEHAKCLTFLGPMYKPVDSAS